MVEADERRERIVLSMPPGLMREVREGAEAEDLLIGEYVRDVLRSELEEDGEETEAEDSDEDEDTDDEDEAEEEEHTTGGSKAP